MCASNGRLERFQRFVVDAYDTPESEAGGAVALGMYGTVGVLMLGGFGLFVAGFIYIIWAVS